MAVLGSGMAKMWLLVLFGLLVVAPGAWGGGRAPRCERGEARRTILSSQCACSCSAELTGVVLSVAQG